MTDEQTRRVIRALKETNDYIDREEKRGADLRPQEIVERLAKYKEHAEYLKDLLNGTKTLPPVFIR